MKNKKCCSSYGKIVAILLVPETPFEDHMSLSTWQDKRSENAIKILDNLKENVENGTAVIIKK